MREREWRGRWWLPGREDEPVGGDLRLSAEEFVLTTDGPLRLPETPAGQTIAEVFRPVLEPVILGRTREGDRLTLLQCDGVIPMIPGEMRLGEWHPQAALVGAHLDQDPRFVVLDIDLGHLEDWSGESGPSHSLTTDNTGRLARVEVSAERRVIGEAQVGRVRIELGVVPLFKTGGPSAEIGHYVRFRVEPAESFSWQDAMDQWVRPLRDLVSFATLRPATLKHLRFRRRDDADDPGRLVELLLRLTDLRHPEEEGRPRRLFSHDLLFTASELPGGLERGVGRWFELHSKYSSVIGLLLSVYYAPFIYEEQRFLALAQAAEVFHGLAIGGTPLPKEAHDQRVTDVVSEVRDSTLGEWAEQILRDSNWYRLRDRLEQLLATAGDIGSEIADPDPDLFLRRIVKTRNYLTHHGEKHHLVIDRAPILFWHGEALAWLVRSLLLRDLGFSPDELAERIRRTSRFQGFKKGLKDSMNL